MSIDYSFKSYVLREHEDLFNKYLATSKYEFAKTCVYIDDNGEVVCHPSFLYHKQKGTLSLTELMHYVEDNKLFKELGEIKKISKARNHRVSRLRSRIASIIECPSLFLTLTFTDNVLETTTPQQRRRYVREFLSKYGVAYVANIDFGKLNHREHYHAVIGCSRVSHKDWKFGDIDFKHIRLTNNRTDSKIAKYIAKLSNHAIKETTKRSVLIYSRV